MHDTIYSLIKKTPSLLLGSILLCNSVAVYAQTIPATTTPPPKIKVIEKTATTVPKKIATVPNEATPTVVPAPVAEFSSEQKLLIENAEKLDALNRELLVRNQQLQLTNEKQSLQVEMLKHDRYSEGTRDTLVTILIGLLAGWLLSRTKKRSRYREF